VTLRRFDFLLIPAAALALTLAAVELAYLTEVWVPFAAAGVAVAVAATLARPLLGLYLAIALAPLELFSIILGGSGGAEGGGFGLSPPEAMLLVTGGAWAVRRIASGQLPLVPSPLNKPLVLLLLAVVPGLAVAAEPLFVLKVLVIWSCLFLVYQLVVDQADAETVRWLLLVLAVSAAIVGLIATIRTGGGSEISLLGQGQTAEGRAEGSFGHPNTLATFESLALPGALALALAGRGPMRALAAAAFALAFAGLVLSLSRGGLLAIAAAVGVMALWAPVRRVALVAALVIVPFALAGASPLGDVQVIDTVSQRISSVEYSAQENQRLDIWAATPEIIMDHFLFGVGTGQFAEVAPTYGLVSTVEEGTFEHAHNIPLTIAAELGLIGLAALLWFAVALVRLLTRAYRRASGLDRGLVLAIAAALLALGIQGMVDYTLRLNLIVATVLVLAGCAVVLSRSARRPADSDLSA
jgi:O-antigen ligase